MDDRRLAEIRNYTDRLRQHDIVAFDTLGFAASYLQELLAEVDALRGALAEAVGAINSLPFDALGIQPGDDVMSPYSIRDELSWRLQTILTPHDCAGEVEK